MTKQKIDGLLYEENEMLHIKIKAYQAALAEKEIELEQKNEAELASMVEQGYQYLQREYSVEKAKSVIESAIAMRSGGQTSCI